jgi:hypothetical protein
MLEDIPNRFNEVVNRPPRPSHSTGRPSGEANNAARLVVPVHAPAGHADPAEPPAAHSVAGESSPVTRITTAPGPGEVASPTWWGNKPMRLSEADSATSTRHPPPTR